MRIEIPKFEESDYVIIAVSGGPDSMALLDMLKNEKCHLVVANVNYRKRDVSDYEQERVSQYCLENNLIFEPLVVKDKAVGNFQNWAREVRYNFFKELYDKYQAKALLVAHHLDDLLETYLIQKQRKIITRFYGIQEETYINNMRVIRPCLNLTKAELLEYCEEHNLFYSIDSSNLEDEYLRNQIRHNILANYSLEDKKKLIKKIRRKNKRNALLFAQVDSLYDKYIHDNVASLDLLKENRDAVILVLFKYINKRTYSLDAIKSIISQLNSKQTNTKIVIDKERVLVKSYSKMYLKDLKDEENKVEYSYLLDSPKEMETPYFKVSFQGDGKHQLKLGYDDFPLTIRNYKDSDYLELKNGKKKVSKIFSDHKIDYEKRNLLPIVVNKKGVILLVSNLTKHYNYSSKRNNYDIELYFFEK